MISDNQTRLSGSQTVDNGVVTVTPQDLDGATAGSGNSIGAVSENYLDIGDKTGRSGATLLGAKNRAGSFADGEMFAVFTVVEEDITPTSGSDETLRFQIIAQARPTRNSPPTFTADATTDVITIAGTNATFLPNGTLVTVFADTGETLPAGLSGNVHYYVVRDEDTTDPLEVKLATSPSGNDNAGASTVVNITDAGTTGGTFTIVDRPQILADSGEVPMSRLLKASPALSGGPAGDQVMIRTNPLPSSPNVPFHRYIFARYLPSAEIATGKVFCDVGISVPDNRGIYYASGYEIK